MFKYFLQQSFFRLFMIATVVAFAGLFAYALILETTKDTPDGVVPFQAMTGKAVVAGVSQDADLTVQRLSNNEVAKLLEQIIAESLSLTPATYDKTVADMAKYFTPEAYRQYTDFLAQGNMKQTLIDQGLQSGAFPEQDPLELNAGVFGGAYKWLLEVPVTLSYVRQGSRGYEGGNPGSMQNRRFVLRTQFSRVKDATDPSAVKIEIWQVSAAGRSASITASRLKPRSKGRAWYSGCNRLPYPPPTPR